MSLTIVIGNKNYSSWSLRGWLALKLTGASFEEVIIPLDQPGTSAAIAGHSPSGKVPVLRDGEVVVFDSLAIAEYLHEKFPAASLWPEDAGARAVARSVAAEMHSGFFALRNAMPMNVRHSAPSIGRTASAEVATEIVLVQRRWAECRRRFGAAGPFLFGRVSLADVAYAPVVWRFTSYGVSLDATSTAYVEAMRALPAMQEWQAAAVLEPWHVPHYDL